MKNVPQDEREQDGGVEDKGAGGCADVLVAVRDADGVDPQPQGGEQVGGTDDDSLTAHDGDAHEGERAGHEPHRGEQSGIEQVPGKRPTVISEFAENDRRTKTRSNEVVGSVTVGRLTALLIIA